MKNRNPLIHDTQRVIQKPRHRQTFAAIHKLLQIPTLPVLLCLVSCTSTSEDSHELEKSPELRESLELTTIELEQLHLGEEDSHSILKNQMDDSLYQAVEGRHVETSNRVIKTKSESIELAKPVFLESYGKDYGIEERQYTSHLIHGFWVVKGLLPRGYTGGTLVAVFDSESGDLFSTLVWK